MPYTILDTSLADGKKDDYIVYSSKQVILIIFISTLKNEFLKICFKKWFIKYLTTFIHFFFVSFKESTARNEFQKI